MPIKVYVLLGHIGPVLSTGFRSWGRYLRDVYGYDVEIIRSGYYKRMPVFLNDVMNVKPHRHLVFCGYSLGANACAWIAKELARMNRPVALIIGFDPTVNGPPLSDYPIEANVKRCICFHQETKLRLTSWAFGRAVYVRAETGPKIETYDIEQDHLLVQFNKDLQMIAEQAIAQVKLDELSGFA